MLFWTVVLIRLQVILSVRESYSKKSIYLQPPAVQNWRVWMFFPGWWRRRQRCGVMVANRIHSQGQSAARRTCRMCKMFRSEAGSKKKKKESWPLVRFSVFPEGVSRSSAVGAWGTAGDSGWKGVFQLDAFHGCFGKRWWKPGEVKLPVPPPGVLAVSEQTKKERQSESAAAQNVFSLLLDIYLSENKPPSEFRRTAASAAPQQGSMASERSHGECSHVARRGR